MKTSFRIGYGYDVHRLTENRDFFLGGIQIPYPKGALGHSDADVLIHAICDALLGALALGDIGHHFPDTDSSLKNIDSKILLKKTTLLIRKEGFEIGNIDASIRLQKPKIAPYLAQMRKVLSECMGIEYENISIKATTTEGLGFEGREEGISASAVCLLFRA